MRQPYHPSTHGCCISGVFINFQHSVDVRPSFGYSRIRSVKYSWCIRSGLLLTQIYLTAIYTTACGAGKQNDQLQRHRCTAEGFWCVHVCPWSRALDSASGSTNETFSQQLLSKNSGTQQMASTCTCAF